MIPNFKIHYRNCIIDINFNSYNDITYLLMKLSIYRFNRILKLFLPGFRKKFLHGSAAIISGILTQS